MRLSAKVDGVGGVAGVRRVRGTRDSFSMVARRPKCVSDWRSSLNLAFSSWEAVRGGGRDC